jgi:hypothetical protein
LSPEQRTGQGHKSQNSSKILLKEKERKSEKESSATEAVGSCQVAQEH